MSSVSTVSGAAPALPQLNIQPHGHGHRHGHVQSADSTDSSGDTAAPVPAATQQSLFGNLLSSLEQAIGLQPPSSTSSTPVTGAVTGSTGSSTAGTAATPNATSASTLLQNYLKNLESVSGASSAKVNVNA
ncbi:MAG TPA: hypothetical protein VHZ53_12495 [Steroidobacteraceae bacterium]|nr:hypothetical protein [Steroidobacteraceae bacterium]